MTIDNSLQFWRYLDQALKDRLVGRICHENMQKYLLSEAKSKATKAAETQTSQLKGASNASVMTVEHPKWDNGIQPEMPPDKHGKYTCCGEATIKLNIFIIKMLNVISAIRLNT